MSPALKQLVPAGSMGIEKFQPPKITQTERQAQEDLVVGWNFDSLDATADKLLQSAVRLEDTIQKETKYWEEVLSVSSRGWSLCRMPNERHTIGVRFGFAEASPMFQSRDLAALRPDDRTGAIILDQGLAGQPRTVRVRLQQGDESLGTSSMAFVATDEQYNLETYIHRARDSLFEEELYYEMVREARTLLAYNVRIQKNAIHVQVPAFNTFGAPKALANTRPTSSTTTLIIDLVPLERHDPQTTASQNASQAFPSQPLTASQPSRFEPTQSPDIDYNSLASLAALSLRLLLSHAHALKFHARTHPPPPLNLAHPPQTPAFELLAPTISFVLHHAAVISLAQKLQSLSERQVDTRTENGSNEPDTQSNETHQAHAKPHVSISSALLTQLHAQSTPQNAQQHAPAPVQLLSALRSPQHSTITLAMPASTTFPTSTSLSVAVSTALAPPYFGTLYTITGPTPLGAASGNEIDASTSASVDSANEHLHADGRVDTVVSALPRSQQDQPQLQLESSSEEDVLQCISALLAQRDGGGGGGSSVGGGGDAGAGAEVEKLGQGDDDEEGMDGLFEGATEDDDDGSGGGNSGNGSGNGHENGGLDVEMNMGSM